jgi:hypothetical protein
MRKSVGCLFPMCACIEHSIGCAHETYDLKVPYWELRDTRRNACEIDGYQPDEFDEVMGG